MFTLRIHIADNISNSSHDLRYGKIVYVKYIFMGSHQGHVDCHFLKGEVYFPFICASSTDIL